MKNSFFNSKFDHQNMLFVLSCEDLMEKGYPFQKLCIFGDSFITDYHSCPLEMIIFKGFVRLPNAPKGFKLAHILDEEVSLLYYRYRNGLSKKKLLKRRNKVSEALFSWAINLPESLMHN